MMSEEKILKSEELNDAELDEVAGGTREQTKSDVEFFKKLGKNLPVTGLDVLRLVDYPVVQEAWARLGVECRAYRRNQNKYYLDGEEITQDQARIHAIKVLKGQK